MVFRFFSSRPPIWSLTRRGARYFYPHRRRAPLLIGLARVRASVLVWFARPYVRACPYMSVLADRHPCARVRPSAHVRACISGIQLRLPISPFMRACMRPKTQFPSSHTGERCRRVLVGAAPPRNDALRNGGTIRTRFLEDWRATLRLKKTPLLPTVRKFTCSSALGLHSGTYNWGWYDPQKKGGVTIESPVAPAGFFRISYITSFAQNTTSIRRTQQDKTPRARDGRRESCPYPTF